MLTTIWIMSYLVFFSQTKWNQRCPSASLDYIVEPWFMGPGGDGPGGPEFKEFQAKEEANGIKFSTSLSDLPPPAQPRLALISGRTADNPRLLTESIANGCKCIYLEKPGAPTVAELQQMKEEAEAAGVEVLMGYNKVRNFVVGSLFFSFFFGFVIGFDNGMLSF